MAAGNVKARGIKPHRLTVEQGAIECRRVVTFKPGGLIGQNGETGGVGFRKNPPPPWLFWMARAIACSWKGTPKITAIAWRVPVAVHVALEGGIRDAGAPAL